MRLNLIKMFPRFFGLPAESSPLHPQPNTRIGEVLARGRAIFPANEYGNEAIIKSSHPIQINLAPVKITEYEGIALCLLFNSPRNLTSAGRYFPGYDCFESSY